MRQSLCGEHPVERVAMRTGQVCGAICIGDADGQFLKPLPANVAGDTKRHGLATRQLADPELGGDFPGGRGAARDVAGLVLDRLEGGRGDFSLSEIHQRKV